MIVGSTHGIGAKLKSDILSVVLAQYKPYDVREINDIQKNIDTICSFMERGATGFPGYDLFVSPEFGVQGLDLVKWRETAIDLDSVYMQQLREKCRQLSVWGVFGVLLKRKDMLETPMNTAITINDGGEIVNVYSKMNPWLPNEESHPGEKCQVFDGPKGSKIATIICADGDYPEIWREAAYNGANVVIRIAHYMAPWEEAWEVTNRSAAYNNQIFVIANNCVGMDKAYSYFGKSMAVNPDGKVIAEAPHGVEYMTKIDIYPGVVEQIRKNHATSNLMYSFNHRGASCPEFDGVGDVVMRYNAYK